MGHTTFIPRTHTPDAHLLWNLGQVSHVSRCSHPSLCVPLCVLAYLCAWAHRHPWVHPEMGMRAEAKGLADCVPASRHFRAQDWGRGDFRQQVFPLVEDSIAMPLCRMLQAHAAILLVVCTCAGVVRLCVE